MQEITDYINNDYKAIEITESIEIVQDFFNETHFSHFPIIEENVYLGCISANDAETFETHKSIKDYRYTLEGFFARKNMIWLDILGLFARNNSNVLPVLGDDNKYEGYYEINDIIKYFYESPFLKEQGGIIIIEKPIVEFSMSQVIQIIESNNGKILGLFISDATTSNIKVTIKIAQGSINEIIQTFRRYNYEIISEHQEDDYLNNLRDRSDYLDRYLNI